MQFAIAVLVFVVVTLAVFAGISLLDQRKAQARVLRDRLAPTETAPDRAPLELALLRDEMLSRIPAFDTLLRRSERRTHHVRHKAMRPVWSSLLKLVRTPRTENTIRKRSTRP